MTNAQTKYNVGEIFNPPKRHVQNKKTNMLPIENYLHLLLI